MASKSGNDEDEKDFLVCGICMDYYDDGVRTPKILECFHSCCITCLKLQAVTSIITCPYCRQETKIKNRVENMVTNFYIMPSVQKLMIKRKSIEQMIAKTKDNWAEAIATRRDAQSKLKMVQDSLKMIENMIIQKSEDNNEKIVILQSLLEDPFCKQDIEELLASQAKCESDHMLSKQELSSANLTLNPLLEIEDFVCCLSLKNNTNGTKFSIKALENKTLSFSNKSLQGPVMGLFQSILSFLLVQLREENLWKEDGTQDGTDQAQACATNLMNGNSISNQEKLLPAFINYYDNDTSSEEISGSENSSGDGHQMCYMQFRINNTIQPKVVFRLNFDEAPMMSRRFMNYCTGSGGLSYKECSIFMNKSGESFTAGKYEDLETLQDQDGFAGLLPMGWQDGRTQRFIADQSTLDESVGALRMRHRGRTIGGVYVCSEFSVICRDHPNNSQMTTVFGYVHSGIEICQQISRLNLEENPVTIHACGEWFP
ncbi:uncharacterized protein LOC124197055 [Daphnia pulex]|uniref:uncharacterized protein LOC124197055 n=1 Tax=Daphnia pulex TaxID=6669 RepID=UPI001EE0FA13|nr:uncharacterized protein LOC124197055 [Daphnia pulex]